MTARRRLAPLALVITCIALGALFAAGFAHTPDIAVVDTPYSIEGN